MVLVNSSYVVLSLAEAIRVVNRPSCKLTLLEEEVQEFDYMSDKIHIIPRQNQAYRTDVFYNLLIILYYIWDDIIISHFEKLLLA